MNPLLHFIVLETTFPFFPQLREMHANSLKNTCLRLSSISQVLKYKVEVFIILTHLSMNSNACRVSYLAKDEPKLICYAVPIGLQIKGTH